MSAASRLSWVWPLVAGVGGGALFASVTHKVQAEAAHPAAEVERIEPTSPRPETPSVEGERAAAFARAFAAAAPTSAAKTPAPEPPPPPHPTDEDRRRQADTEWSTHETLLRNRTSESRDSAWAHDLETKLDDSMHRLPSELTARYEASDCRSTTCAVKVSWASRAQAQTEMQTDMHFASVAGCTTRLTLGPEEQGESRYSATFLVDCASSRQVQPGVNPAERPL